MTPDAQREAALFQAAIQLTGPDRAAFLDRACGGDAALRHRLQALLVAHEQSEGVLAEPAPAAKATMKLEFTDAPDETVGQKIGRYKILEKVGEGGCGVVYVAEQTEPVRRRVALKVIKLGMDTKQVVARFEAERQALAMMDHPNIAKVLDGGATETGRPYFIMELVRGIKITDYCDQASLNTKERLGLFIQVCHAIQHAHQKGIIHRDIKPSNILVTLNDGVAVPKVIDFGIAKATEGRLTDATVYTQLNQFIGTPAYMSPEQAEMTSLDIDTRSDIYSLGVLLYELLAGSTPFDTQELMSQGIDQMRKTIREQEPARPSARLATLPGDELTTAAKRRAVEAPKLIHQLKGDLDWIVMKCLEKDRSRRYETANGLAADLKRHLNNEPVVARPPSKLYEFQKTVRRHKFGFAATAAIILVLTAGVLISTWQAVRATQAKQEALSARQQAEASERKALAAQVVESKLRGQAQTDEQTAQTEAARSAQVAQFLTDMLKGVGPSVALGRDTTLLREILDQTAQRLDTLKAEPEVESDLRLTLGGVYRDLGDYPQAEAMLQQALAIRKKLFGEKSLQVAAVLDVLGQVLHRDGKPDEAEAAYRQALATREELAGHESLETASSLNHLGSLLRSENKRAEAETDLREGLALRRKLLPPNDPEIANSLSDLGIVLGAEGKLSEAGPTHLEALAIRQAIFPPDHPQIADSLMQLGTTLELQTNYPGAETNILAALAIQRKVLGDHRDTANTLDRLGSVLEDENRLPEAEERFREALAMRNKVFGESATTDDKLIDVLTREGKQAEVARLLSEQSAAWDGKSKENRPLLKTADTLIANGRTLIAAGKPAEGEAAYRKALQIRRSYLGDQDPALLQSLAKELYKSEKYDRAEAVNRELVDLETKLHGPESTNVVIAMQNLLMAVSAQSKYSEAETIGREARALQMKLKLNDRNVGEVLEALGLALLKQGKKVEAAACFREIVANTNSASHPRYISHRNLAEILRGRGELDEAVTEYRAAAEVAKSVKATYWWGSSLGEAALVFKSQGKQAEAQPLLREVATCGNCNVFNKFAWDLATSPRPEMRDGSNAVILAEKAVALTSRTNAAYLDTLAAAYAAVGKFDQAVASEQEALALLPKGATNSSFVLALSLYQSSKPYRDHGALAEQVMALLSFGKFAEAEPLARECLALREKLIPDEWFTFNARSMLGGSLLGQKKYAEAEPLLLSGYEGLKLREKQIPAEGKMRPKEAAERLVQLYEATGQTDKAAEWRQKLAALNTPP